MYPVPPLFTNTNLPISDVQVLRAITKMVEDWVKSKSPFAVNQSPTLREKSILLVKMMQFMEKRFPDELELNGQFLELVNHVYRDETLKGTELTSKLEPAFMAGLRCVQPTIRAKFFEFVVPAQQTNPSAMDTTEEAVDNRECEAFICAVLERQGCGDVAFVTYCDVDEDVETWEGLSDSDFIDAAYGESSSGSNTEEQDIDDDDNPELQNVPCPSVAEAAQALDVMRVFAKKTGLMDQLAFHLDGF
ncbi:hypothetical protein HPB51_020187 [Rhipicephalus microplus]|uniref:Uncharacterized protein n=1 Tax=Rhipicephalus microplus TaxID=6941 RepID=A0A9J6D7S9_RHIMP|nr:hypothetical protein HPB51_020187 [Rhipicephalus microplus]